MKLTEQQIVDILTKHAFRMSDIFNDGLIVITADEFEKIAKDIIEKDSILNFPDRVCPNCTAVSHYDEVIGIYKCNECTWEGQY